MTPEMWEWPRSWVMHRERLGALSCMLRKAWMASRRQALETQTVKAILVRSVEMRNVDERQFL